MTKIPKEWADVRALIVPSYNDVWAPDDLRELANMAETDGTKVIFFNSVQAAKAWAEWVVSSH